MSGSRFTNLKRTFVIAFIIALVAVAAGCTTSYDEWAGKMSNEKPAQSVQGDQQRRANRERDSESVVLRRVPAIFRQ